jgi:hypothetical protein
LYIIVISKNGKFSDIRLLTFFLCGINENSSSLLIMHMSSLASLGHGGGITAISPNVEFGATHLRGHLLHLK